MILVLKNIISYAVFSFLRIFLGRRNFTENTSILFFNSEKIGDLVVSSVILENDEELCRDRNIYFLIKRKNAPLFSGYEGKIKIISYNYGLYKWFLPYRIVFLIRLRNLKLNALYNLTPARGILNDEISLLGGANKIYASSGELKFLKGIEDRTGKLYDDILFEGVKNEYLKHENLLCLLGIRKDKIIYGNKKTFGTGKSHYLIFKNEIKKYDYIVVSPLSTEPERTWGKENFQRLCRELSANYKIVVTGSGKEKKILEEIKNGNENIYVDTSSLGDLSGLIENCRLFIGGDSGLTHIALKLGKPLLAVLDGGYFNRYFPYKEENEKNNYIYNMMECFECGFDCIHDKKLCLTEIKYDDVMNKTKEILKKYN